MGYNKKERVTVKLEFLRMMIRLRLDPARMKLLTIFFETYMPLTETENEQLVKKIEQTELKEEAMVMEWLTSWEKKGLEQGRQESKEEIATKMLAKGLDPAIVEELTGLPAGRIRELSLRPEVDKVT